MTSGAAWECLQSSVPSKIPDAARPAGGAKVRGMTVRRRAPYEIG